MEMQYVYFMQRGRIAAQAVARTLRLDQGLWGVKRLVYITAPAAIIVLGLGVVSAIGFLSPSKQKMSMEQQVLTGLIEGRSESAKIKALTQKNEKLRVKLAALAPKGNYIVVDTAENVLSVMRGGSSVYTAKVSSGSGNMLLDKAGGRQWVFDTPRGQFSVGSKLLEPDWIKPDWAFIEEGQSVPSNWGDRVEPGMLGEYALGFGNGYFIHGTLYTRLIGRNVTHGCIRAGNKDLEFIYKNAQVGTKVYIF